MWHRPDRWIVRYIRGAAVGGGLVLTLLWGPFMGKLRNGAARGCALSLSFAFAVSGAGVGCGSVEGSGGSGAASGSGSASGSGATTDGGAFFGGDGGGVILRGGTVDASDPNCQRVIDVTTNVVVATPPPFDVIIVADNSDSLSWSHSDLASGFQNFLTYVHGRAVRFFLLTTTQYGQSSKVAASPQTGKDLVTWSSSVTGNPYADPMAQYTETCTAFDGGTMACPAPSNWNPYSLRGAWTFTLPPPIAAITETMTDAEIAVQQQAIANAIVGLGGGGASEEQPLCTLSRYITQPSSQLPQYADFLVLSDEDDKAPPDHCLAAYDYRAAPSSPLTREACTAAHCDGYSYTMGAPLKQTSLTYSCVPQDDNGTLHPDLARPATLPDPAEFVATCASTASKPCSSSELTLAGNDCGSGWVVQNCTAACGPSNSSYGCGFDASSATPDLCTSSFSSGGTTYSNLADYCTKTIGAYAWANCSVFGYDNADGGVNGYSSSESTTLVLNATSPADVIAQFKTKANQVFADGGYQVETIQLDPAFSCPLGPGESYGTNLRTLASDDASVFPLCQSYTGVLQHVQNFADSLIQTAYSVSVGAQEDVEGVTIVSAAGVARTISPSNFTYDKTAGVLHLAAGVLMSGDSGLRVDIGRNCAPR